MKQSVRQNSASVESLKIRLRSINYTLIPLLAAIFCVPLIVREHVYDSGLSDYAWYPNSYEELDLFLYWKGAVLVVFAAIMLVFLAVLFAKAIRNRRQGAERFFSIRRDYWLFFLLGFGLLALLSTLLSPYREFGFRGSLGSFETVWVILAYCLLLFYTYYVVRNDKDLSAVRAVLFASFLIMGLLGIGQMLDLDFYGTSLARRFIFSDKHIEWRETAKLGTEFSSVNKVYSAQGNPNYTAHFLSLALPVSALLIIASGKTLHRALWGVVTVLLFVSTLGTGNRVFLSVLCVILLTAACFLRKGIRKHRIAAVTVFAVVIGSVFICYRNVDQVRGDSSEIKEQDTLDDAKMLKDHVRFVYNGTPLLVSFTELPNGLEYAFRDENGTVLDFYQDDNRMVCLSDERYDGLRFMQYYGDEEHPFYASAVVHDDPFLFGRDEDGYFYVTIAGKVDELVETPSALPTSLNHIVTMRGYIWSKSIPLMKDRLLLGSGADSFIQVFPNNDYLGRFNTDNNTRIIDKPHNLYLQIGVQYGGLSLLLFLGIVLVYLIRSVKLYRHIDLHDPRQLLGLGLMLGILGYLIVSLANDSHTSVAPFFWFLLGLGFAVNRMNRKEKQSAK